MVFSKWIRMIQGQKKQSNVDESRLWLSSEDYIGQ